VNSSVRRFIVVLLLAVVVYGTFVVLSGYENLKAALTTYEWSTFVLALVLTSVNYLIRFGKWEFYLKLLHIGGISKGHSLLVFLSGFVLTVTPGKLGEVFKSAVLSQTHGVDPARTAPIILAERLTDVIAIIFLITWGSISLTGGLAWALAGTIVVFVALTLALWPPPLEKFISLLEAKSGWGARMAPRLKTAQASLRIVASPSALLIPTALSIVGWGLEGVGLWLLISGFGESAPLLLSVFIYATATLAGALVPLPGGLGIAETMFQSQMIELAGVGPGSATASMLLIRFATLWWAVIVGFCALGILRLLYPTLLRSKPSP